MTGWGFDDSAIWSVNKGWDDLKDDEILKQELALDQAEDRK